MLTFDVLPQIDLPLESLLTNFAAEGVKVGAMLAHVRDQVGRLAEGLAAEPALVRLFAGVDEGVLLHVGLLVEALAAVGAGVRAGVGVDQQMGRAVPRGAISAIDLHVLGFIILPAPRISPRVLFSFSREISTPNQRARDKSEPLPPISPKIKSMLLIDFTLRFP